jgi:hypothetical protein
MLLPKNAHRERGISRKQETTDLWKVITREMEFRFFLSRTETDMKSRKTEFIASTAVWVLGLAISTQGQMIDNTQAPNTAKAGINKSLLDEIGSGRSRLEPVCPTVVLLDTTGRGARRAWGATWSRARTAATLRICSAWA